MTYKIRKFVDAMDEYQHLVEIETKLQRQGLLKPTQINMPY